MSADSVWFRYSSAGEWVDELDYLVALAMKKLNATRLIAAEKTRLEQDLRQYFLGRLKMRGLWPPLRRRGAVLRRCPFLAVAPPLIGLMCTFVGNLRDFVRLSTVSTAFRGL